MKIFVTAGNTQTPLDRVRCITNIFSGRTGTQIAALAYERGHSVVLATSHPDMAATIMDARPREEQSWHVRPYRTFDDLEQAMAEEIANASFDAIIHAAAVSDYRSAGTFALAPDSHFHDSDLTWRSAVERPRLVSAAAGKIKSSHQELWLRLVPTHKLVDRIRSDWKFSGLLVKFKLEVDLSDTDLERVAEEARLHSGADFMVANTLEEMEQWALLGDGSGQYRKLPRARLGEELLDAIEARYRLRESERT